MGYICQQGKAFYASPPTAERKLPMFTKGYPLSPISSWGCLLWADWWCTARRSLDCEAGLLCERLARSFRVDFPISSKDMHVAWLIVRLGGNLPTGVIVSVYSLLSLFFSPAMNWRLALSPASSQRQLQHPRLGPLRDKAREDEWMNSCRCRFTQAALKMRQV